MWWESSKSLVLLSFSHKINERVESGKGSETCLTQEPWVQSRFDQVPRVEASCVKMFMIRSCRAIGVLPDARVLSMKLCHLCLQKTRLTLTVSFHGYSLKKKPGLDV
jgi:hypothetical protein